LRHGVPISARLASLRHPEAADTLIVTVRSPRVLCAARAWKRAAPIALACGIASVSARAAPPSVPPPPPGADALASARTAWDKGQFDAAETFYKSALDHGGLAPEDTLDAYVHLGTARAVLGKKTLARAAFRQAALIDRKFALPPEGGRKANAIASAARKEEAKLGSIRLAAKFPDQVPSGAPFRVSATLDAKHAAVTAKIGIDARDPASGRHWSTSEVASVKVRFDVPADMVTPGATLVVRVDALDPHDNRLATREARVIVEGTAPVEEPPPTPVAAPSPAVVTLPLMSFEAAAPLEEKKSEKSGGGFWSSPWPYLLGGVALAAGGAAVYIETRPTDDVSIGAARVNTR
jgi:hypothetical protein